jgi:carbon monoxide dehydrogenase subunit G
MAGFQRSLFVNRPVEAVFDFATNLANASVLLPGVTKIEMLPPGEMKPGAKFRETRGVRGKERTVVLEVVEHNRPEVHAVTAAMMGMRATYRFRFSPEGGGTHVNMEAVVQGNFLWWLFLGMMSRMMEKEDGEYLTRLKEAMEPTSPV